MSSNNTHTIRLQWLSLTDQSVTVVLNQCIQQRATEVNSGVLFTLTQVLFYIHSEEIGDYIVVEKIQGLVPTIPGIPSHLGNSS